ncbi:MAG TPA: heavy metal-binding domain-containing protein, partial [Candidatus Goldiibacteriota bacterium]|nr:heavy metal-binding domain-containing protein [Candidatus Goldiibacteriota bacterium]
MSDIIIFLVLLAIGFTTGTIIESAHFKSIRKREKELLGIPVVTLEKANEDDTRIDSVYLATGECVVALDYFKMVLAGLKGIIGGRLGSYETLIDRGRR